MKNPYTYRTPWRKKKFNLNPVRYMVHDSHFADGKLKSGDILLTKLSNGDFKRSLKSFLTCLIGSKKIKKAYVTLNRSEEIGLRMTLALTLSETGTYCRHWSRGVTGSDLHTKIRLLCREDNVQGKGCNREATWELLQ